MTERRARGSAKSRRLQAFALVAVIAVVGAGGWAIIAATQSPETEDCPDGAECVVIHTSTGDHLFTVEWAVTASERACGLMFREEMPSDHGMVFDFRVERAVSFWMSNTLISLDMIFIEDGGEVLSVAEFTTPLSLEGVPSAGPVRYVLEVVGGTAGRIGLSPGDMIDLERASGVTAGTAICYPPPE